MTGDWQKFKGLPAPAPLLVAEPKVERLRRDLFAKAVAGFEDRTSRGRRSPRRPRSRTRPRLSADAESTEA